MRTFKHTQNPITEAQLEDILEKDEQVMFEVLIPLDDLIWAKGIDDINNICDETIFANVSAMLTDIGYSVGAKFDDDQIVLNVTTTVEGF